MSVMVRVEQFLKKNNVKEMYDAMLGLDPESKSIIVRLEYCTRQVSENQYKFMTDQKYEEDRIFYSQFNAEDILKLHDFLNYLHATAVKRSQEKIK